MLQGSIQPEPAFLNKAQKPTGLVVAAAVRKGLNECVKLIAAECTPLDSLRDFGY